MVRQSRHWQLIKQDIHDATNINIETFEVDQNTVLPILREYCEDPTDPINITKICLTAKHVYNFTNGSLKNIARYLMMKSGIPHMREEKQVAEYRMRITYTSYYNEMPDRIYNEEFLPDALPVDPASNNRRSDCSGHVSGHSWAPIRYIFEGKKHNDPKSTKEGINQLISITGATAEQLNYTGCTYMVLLTCKKFYLAKFDASKKRELQNIVFNEYRIFTEDQLRINEWIRFLFDFQNTI